MEKIDLIKNNVRLRRIILQIQKRLAQDKEHQLDLYKKEGFSMPILAEINEIIHQYDDIP